MRILLLILLLCSSVHATSKPRCDQSDTLMCAVGSCVDGTSPGALCTFGGGQCTGGGVCKPSGICNVKSSLFGAVGNNSTDDSNAIQLALDTCGQGGTIFFPVGHYRANNLRVQQGQTLVGAGVCDISLTPPCGTVIEPLSAAGALTVFLSQNQAAGCTHGSAGTPKCADGVTFRDMLVEANGPNDVAFDLSNMNETLIDHVYIFGRRVSPALGQIGIKIAALNNGVSSPTGGLDTRVIASKVFNLTTGARVMFGNGNIFQADHFFSNTVAVQIDGLCGSAACTTGGAINTCVADADCAGCGGGTCINSSNLGGTENALIGNIMELNATEILDVGGATKIQANHVENGSGAGIGIDERGRNAAITGNSFVNNVSAQSILLTSATSAPVATRIDIRDNDFIGGGPYITESNASTAIEVGRNLYGGAGAPVTTSASSGVRWIDTTEGILVANLPTNIADGSLLFATNAKNSDPCATTGSGPAGFFARRQGGRWLCDGYVLGVGNGANNRVAFWSPDANTLSSNGGFTFNAPNLGLSTLRSPFVGLVPLHVEAGSNEDAFFDFYNGGGSGSQIIGRHARGTVAGGELPVQNGDVLATFGGRGWQGNGTPGNGGFVTSSRGRFECFASETWSGTNQGAYCSVTGTNTGTTTTAEIVRFGPNPVNPLTFDGANQGDGKTTTVVLTEPTGVRTLTIPDANSVTATPINCDVPTNQAIGQITSGGQVVCKGKPQFLAATNFFSDVVGAATLLGDMLTVNGSNNWVRFPGATAAGKNFLTSTPLAGVAQFPAWGPIAPADIAHNVLSTTHSDTETATPLGGSPPVKGDLMVASSSPKWARQPVGSDQQVVMTGVRQGTGNVRTSKSGGGGPPDDTVASNTLIGAYPATIFNSELRAGDTITLIAHDGTTQSSVVATVGSNTTLTVFPLFTNRCTDCAYQITSQTAVQWQQRGGAEFAFYRLSGTGYFAGSITFPTRPLAPDPLSVRASTSSNGFPYITMVPYITGRKGTLASISYFLTDNGVGTGNRCRIAVYDSKDPPSGNVNPGHAIYREAATTGDADVSSGACPIEQGNGVCVGGTNPGTPCVGTSGGGACLGGGTCQATTDFFCQITRIPSSAPTLYPNQLYWIAIQCNENHVCLAGPNAGNECTVDAQCPGSTCTTGAVRNAPNIRAFAKTSSWGLTGYDPDNDTSLNQLVVQSATYAGTLPDSINASNILYRGGPLPGLQVAIN